MIKLFGSIVLLEIFVNSKFHFGYFLQLFHLLLPVFHVICYYKYKNHREARDEYQRSFHKADLQNIYQGTFGLFSLLLVIVLAVCYGMERNEPQDKVASYVIVALGAYGVQLNIGSADFAAAIGAGGSFSAMFIALFACYLYEKLRKVSALSLKKYSTGMESLCANAIQTLLPMAVIMAISI